jgi:hypothetical protein
MNLFTYYRTICDIFLYIDSYLILAPGTHLTLLLKSLKSSHDYSLNLLGKRRKKKTDITTNVVVSSILLAKQCVSFVFWFLGHPSSSPLSLTASGYHYASKIQALSGKFFTWNFPEKQTDP